MIIHNNMIRTQHPQHDYRKSENYQQNSGNRCKAPQTRLRNQHERETHVSICKAGKRQQENSVK